MERLAPPKPWSSRSPTRYHPCTIYPVGPRTPRRSCGDSNSGSKRRLSARPARPRHLVKKSTSLVPFKSSLHFNACNHQACEERPGILQNFPRKTESGWQESRNRAEGNGSRTHQTCMAGLTGFEVRARHRDALSFRCGRVTRRLLSSEALHHPSGASVKAPI